MRSRTSFWNPFMTDKTTISAATPSAIPAMEAAEMKDMKPFRRDTSARRRPDRV
jgi:hypothetical protein